MKQTQNNSTNPYLTICSTVASNIPQKHTNDDGDGTTACVDAGKRDKVFQVSPALWCDQQDADLPSPTKYFYNYAECDMNRQKTPMCLIAELARHNNIKHVYNLIDEEGPAHKKQFTVSLVLTSEEVYYGYGPSIKKAQQAAAENALEKTKLKKPETKSNNERAKKDNQNAVVLLSYVAKRLGYELTFIDETDKTCQPSRIHTPLQPVVPNLSNIRAGLGNGVMPVSEINPTSPRPLVNPSLVSTNGTSGITANGVVPFIGQRFIFPPPQGVGVPYVVPPPFPPVRMIMQAVRYSTVPRRTSITYQFRLTLSSGPSFVGTGLSAKKAKINAADQALNYLGPSLARLEAQLKKERQQKNCKSEDNAETSPTSELPTEQSSCPVGMMKPVISTTRNGKPKSSISQIHECALHMRMNVEFSILKEEGPSHDRHYVMRCKLISNDSEIVADGDGSSKKLAKQNACSLMLTKLESVEASPLFIATSIYKSQRRVTVPKELKRKTISKDKKMDPEYGHEINPISRLIQVLQAQKKGEPKFELIAERGQNRYKEFVMEVVCDFGLRCEGTGPNKKLAKRAAAEAALAEIGYAKPMPKPGKSLLKKRVQEPQETPVEIGVFSVEDAAKATENGANADDVKEDKADERLEVNKNEQLSEVTLSVTASIGSQVMTFADVDKAVRTDEQEGVWGVAATESSSFHGKDEAKVSNEESKDEQRVEHPKRRVTFSNEVSSCPPPDECGYPLGSKTPLKSEVVIVNKIRRRGRDSKKVLSGFELKWLVKAVGDFLASRKVENDKDAKNDDADCGNGAEHMRKSFICDTCISFLDNLSKTFKFSVCYTDFPKAESEPKNQYFSLVSIGIEKPIVCHGSGSSQVGAHEDAAFNVLSYLSSLEC